MLANGRPSILVATCRPERTMNLIARARRYLSTSRRAARRSQDDPADMGTAFGLDAITTIQPESPAESAARERSLGAGRMALRLHRRSTF
jgi:hypothetical protein